MYFSESVKNSINNSYRLFLLSEKNALVDSSTFNQIEKSGLFKHDEYSYNSKLIELSFQNEYIYKYICKSLKNAKKGFKIYNADAEEENIFNKCNIYNVSNYNFINAIDSYIEENLISLNKDEKKRVEILKKLVNIGYFLYQNKDCEINMVIDNVNCSFSLDNFVYLLNLTKDEFNSIYLNEEILTFIDFNKYRLLYAAIKFFEDNNLDVLYNLPPNMKEKFEKDSYMYDIDIEAVNSINNLNKMEKDYGNIDKNLKTEILGEMPAGLAKIDIVIYIYAKMCEIFNFDPMFKTEDKNLANVIHNSQETINNIKLDNTNINSKEFMAIFTTLLQDLDIDYAISAIINFDDYDRYGECFNPSSYNIVLRVDKYLLKVDFMKAIAIDAVENTALLDFVGIECVNKHPFTQTSFKKKIEEHNELIALKSNVNYIGDIQYKLQDLIYKAEKFPSNQFEHKLAFILNNYNKVFTTKEREKNINLLTFPSAYTDESCCVVFVTNGRKLQKNNSYNNNYYMYKTGFGLIRLDPSQFNYMYNETKDKTK